MNNVRIDSRNPVHRQLSDKPVYRAAPVPKPFSAISLADPENWLSAQVAEVGCFHAASSAHRPQTQARVLFDPQTLYVRFDVADRYVRSVRTEAQALVSKDSCVEFFVQPAGSIGYFNFEVNAGGAMLVYFIEDPQRGERTLFRKYAELPVPLVKSIPVFHTLPTIVEPESTDAVNWTVAFSVPKSLFELFVPGAWSRRDRPWHCNFFKCGDETSHPHWASWSDIGETLRFHQPDKFAQLLFDLRGTPALQALSTEGIS